MHLLLLAIIYLTNIGLGLPNSILGSAWPILSEEFTVPLSYLGIITTVGSISGIISSLLMERLVKRFGSNLIMPFCMFMSMVALYGFSRAASFLMFCFFMIIAGFCIGLMGAVANNYAALHYTSGQLSWMHCFWGIGATVSPYIMGYILVHGYGWSVGYQTVALIQLCLVMLLVAVYPLWHKDKVTTKINQNIHKNTNKKALKLSEILKIKGVLFLIMCSISYCAIEQTAGNWSTTYLVEYRGVDKNIAARYAALFFLGITAGRFLSGFVATKLGNRRLIRISIGIILIGIAAVLIPIKSNFLCLNGLLVIGLGCAPVFPTLIHAAPENFGKANSPAVIGVMLACSPAGAAIPPLFGILGDKISYGIFPIFILVFAGLLIYSSEKMNKIIGVKNI